MQLVSDRAPMGEGGGNHQVVGVQPGEVVGRAREVVGVEVDVAVRRAAAAPGDWASSMMGPVTRPMLWSSSASAMLALDGK